MFLLGYNNALLPTALPEPLCLAIFHKMAKWQARNDHFQIQSVFMGRCNTDCSDSNLRWPSSHRPGLFTTTWRVFPKHSRRADRKGEEEITLWKELAVGQLRPSWAAWPMCSGAQGVKDRVLPHCSWDQSGPTLAATAWPFMLPPSCTLQFPQIR